MIKTTNKKNLAFWLSILLDLHYLAAETVYIQNGDPETITFREKSGEGWETYCAEDCRKKITELTPETDRIFRLVESIEELSQLLSFLMEEDAKTDIRSEEELKNPEEIGYVMAQEGDHLCSECTGKCDKEESND